MSYTGLILPHHKPRITHKKVFAAFAVLAGVYIVGVLAFMIMSVQKGNRELAQKLAGFSTKATNVSAPIVTPSATDQQANFAPIDQSEAASLVETTASLAVVPIDEAPTLALVVNTAKLSQDLFFRDAEVGDQLLVYEKAGLAIIYRPSIKKLVALGNIKVGGGGQTKGASSAQQPIAHPSPVAPTTAPQKIAVYYVNDTPEMRADIAVKLRTVAPDALIVSQSPVKSGVVYDQTTIIDLKGGQSELVSQIATALGGAPGTEAQGEQLPSDADVLIIIANK